MRVIAWGILALLAGPALQAWAQVPAGTTFQVNTYTTGRQAYPRLAMEPGGGFMVAWDSGPLGFGPNLHARRFAADGASVGGEFRVNVTPAILPATFGDGGLALSPRGVAVVTWSDAGGGSPDVFGRRVSATGLPLGGDFQVNQATTGDERRSSVAFAPDGRFVVVWDDVDAEEVFGRRFDAFGNPLGADFQVNAYTTGRQAEAEVAIDAAGNFTVVWTSLGQDAPNWGGIFAQRFDGSGARRGDEFQVNTYSTGSQSRPAIAMTRAGESVVVWSGVGEGLWGGVWARRIDRAGVPVGNEFDIAHPSGSSFGGPDVGIDEPGNFVVAWYAYYSIPTSYRVQVRRYAADGTPRGAAYPLAAVSTVVPHPDVLVASDAVGNFVVAWHDIGDDDREVSAQRQGGLFPAAMTIIDHDTNGVLEVSEGFALGQSWRNLTGLSRAFQSQATRVETPPGLSLSLSPAADYGTVDNGAVGACVSCRSGVLTGTRPPGHVDLAFVETIVPDTQGQAKRWALHVGESFGDMPQTSGFYRSVETLLHRGVTAGCGPSLYCPAASTTREQMAVFLLLAKEASTYAPPVCTSPMFADVPASSPFCPWIEELARRGVTSGCGGGNYCPSAAVSREQMAVFLLRTLDPTLSPPACAPPNTFNDVPETSAFCRWIEELGRRGVTSGCGGGNYCPADPVTREQMAVFLTGTFGLTLYGP
jgi:hypothetical protein